MGNVVPSYSRMSSKAPRHKLLNQPEGHCVPRHRLDIVEAGSAGAGPSRPAGLRAALARLSHRALTTLILIATFVILMALAISTARNVLRGDALALAAAEESVTRAANVAQSLLDRHLLQVEGQLTSLAEWLGQGFISADEPMRASSALRQLTAHSYTHNNLMLTDAQGEVWASAIPARIGHSLPLARSALTRVAPAGVAQEAAAPDEGAILHGPLLSLETGETILLMLRRVALDERGLPILAAAEIPTALITAVLAPMVNPPQLRVRLENREGLILAAGPGQVHLVGQALPRPAQPLRRDERVERTPNRQGDGDVFATARPIMLPGLLAVAVLPDSAALGGWPVLRLRIVVGLVIVTLLLLALSAAVFFATWIRQRAVLERDAANARLLAAIESLPDGFIYWDAEDRLVVCNSRYKEFFGPAQAMLSPGVGFIEVARHWVERNIIADRDLTVEERLAGVLEVHRTTGEPLERQLTDGRWLRIARQRMAGGGVVVILSDITALKQAMVEIGEARDAAGRAMAAKSNLLAHVSHELRTPLSGLLRLADGLSRETSLSGTQRHQAGLVGATARHLLALANEVLDLAAMEARSLTLNPGIAVPAEIFREALAMVQPLAEAKRVTLDLTEENLPGHIEVDATRLRQMALNLLANAVKFTPDGSKVRLHVVARDTPEILRFEVNDQGRGVPEPERARLFRDFTRLAASEAEGTGLGLSISARLAGLMGGRIGCTDADPAPGACFWVELPLKRAAPAPRAAPPLDGHRLRLLAVDDTHSNLSVLRALLSTTGFELETVSEGQAALEAVEIAAREGRPFDLVLMDVMMPGMDGLEATRRLRALPGTMGGMPIIAVTASAFPEDIATCRAAGMVGHVTKPVELAALMRAIAVAVTAAEAPAGAAVPDALTTLRPMFLAELRTRLAELDAALRDGRSMVEAVHALAGTVGHLGEGGLVIAARSTLKALRDGDAQAPALAAALLRDLCATFPEAAATTEAV